MEQGVAPVIISTMILHTLAGRKMIDINMGSKIDRELFQAAQKLLSIVITFVQAILCLFSGMYGPVEALGIINSTLIVVQLCMAGLIIILLDELLQKGYGLGNGVSLFTAANIFGSILWATFAFTSIPSPQGTLEFEGIVPFFLHSIVRWNGIYDSVFRTYGPNLINLVNTLLITFAVNFYQNHRVELGLKSKRVREANAKLPIRLLYTSNIPMFMECGIVLIIFFVS